MELLSKYTMHMETVLNKFQMKKWKDTGEHQMGRLKNFVEIMTVFAGLVVFSCQMFSAKSAILDNWYCNFGKGSLPTGDGRKLSKDHGIFAFDEIDLVTHIENVWEYHKAEETEFESFDIEEFLKRFNRRGVF